MPDLVKKLFIILSMYFLSLFAHAEHSEICLAPVAAATSGEPGLSNPTARQNPYHFEVQFGNARLQQDTDKTQCITVSSDTRIPVIIRDSGIRKASFYINLPDYPHGVCVWYKPLYDTWSVWGLDISQHLCPN